MIDIIEVKQGFDLGLADTAVGKAANVLSTQLEDLEYAPELGVDLKFFLNSEFQIQNESFRAYLVERLTHHQVNVSEVLSVVSSLFEKYTFYVDNQTTEGFVR